MIISIVWTIWTSCHYLYISSLPFTKYIFNVLKRRSKLQAGGEKSEVKYAEFDHQSITVLHAHSWTQIQRVTPLCNAS
jgi:hypothetical protein